ncbi:acetoacetate--CoA ligase [Gemmatimonas aurantiaca]|uniref:acetoacetate--CoA ligase n=1 Tax=Gemmatimonas aurantiaca TaxID=173480 RepID=UPI00301D1142
MTDPSLLWKPSARDIAATRLQQFLNDLVARGVVPTGGRDAHALQRWSVTHPERFWAEVWRAAGIMADGPGTQDAPWRDVLVGGDRMAPPDPVHGPRWFTETRLNFAEHLLRRRDDGLALVSWNEQGPQQRLTYATLATRVAQCAAALAARGVGVGDRVAGWMPNLPETVIAMLAAASLGAVWSSCSPDFGTKGVLDRFGQIAPTVLIAADGYRYAGKTIDCLPRLAEIVSAIPSLRAVWVVPYMSDAPALDTIDRAERFDQVLAAEAQATTPAFGRLPFDHPLYIMYSSGTTGLPKCMVHGAGGTLLQHWKELALHTDVSADDVLFYFTTCGWMMWNWLVSGLAVGATVVLYDGAPLAPDPAILWRMAEAERVSVFGTSAKYLAVLEKEGVTPRTTVNLEALRAILSTGSPLAAHSYDFVYRDISPSVRLCSISGGTDIISCFALGDPTGAVYRGELQMRGLGMAVAVWNDVGQPVEQEAGELVCTRPFPSMPVAFWNDPDGSLYRAAYFEHFPGVWRHGDWAEITAHDGLVIHGRSDATLNPGGVRIGTAEIYRQVEQIPEVLESLVVEQRFEGADGPDSRVVLFVRLRDGGELTEALRDTIRRRIREHTSPHHVPRVVIAVPDIPRTISGKITELAVRETIHGRPVKNQDALANPEALAHFRDRPELVVGPDR